jgi:hypothetical protein
MADKPIHLRLVVAAGTALAAFAAVSLPAQTVTNHVAGFQHRFYRGVTP